MKSVYICKSYDHVLFFLSRSVDIAGIYYSNVRSHKWKWYDSAEHCRWLVICFYCRLAWNVNKM